MVTEREKFLTLDDLYNEEIMSCECKDVIRKAIGNGKNILIVGTFKSGKTLLTRCITNELDFDKSVLVMSSDGDVKTGDFTDRVGLKLSKASFNSRMMEKINCDTDAFDVLVVDEIRPLLINTGEQARDMVYNYSKDSKRQLIVSLSRPIFSTTLKESIEGVVPKDMLSKDNTIVVSLGKEKDKTIVKYVGKLKEVQQRNK